MDDIHVNGHHRLSTIVLAALRDGRHHLDGVPAMMARAVRAVLDADPSLSITQAYALVNYLWIR